MGGWGGRYPPHSPITPLAPVVLSYLTSVLLPAASGQMSLRSERELRSLAMAIDYLLTGETVKAADLLIRRFQEVETAHADGNWTMARHSEVLPEGRVASITAKQREQIIKTEAAEAKPRAMARGSNC